MPPQGGDVLSRFRVVGEVDSVSRAFCYAVSTYGGGQVKSNTFYPLTYFSNQCSIS